jgi:hypothetical protein
LHSMHGGSYFAILNSMYCGSYFSAGIRFLMLHMSHFGD